MPRGGAEKLELHLMQYAEGPSEKYRPVDDEQTNRQLGRAFVSMVRTGTWEAPGNQQAFAQQFALFDPENGWSAKCWLEVPDSTVVVTLQRNTGKREPDDGDFGAVLAMLLDFGYQIHGL
ncbi:hypothetical protein [Dactylosporangium sp. NPDC049140]|uniref:hypothetical protein n=1 Tax=Dactylosporangium sp. NPDC049140 TaxID=3155647 RepID=UPI0033C330F0